LAEFFGEAVQVEFHHAARLLSREKICAA
jgi:hypothetical protein